MYTELFVNNYEKSQLLYMFSEVMQKGLITLGHGH